MNYWYYRLRTGLIVVLVLLIISTVAGMLIFDQQLFLNLVMGVMYLLLGAAIIGTCAYMLWKSLDGLLPKDPRKGKDDDEPGVESVVISHAEIERALDDALRETDADGELSQ